MKPPKAADTPSSTSAHRHGRSSAPKAISAMISPDISFAHGAERKPRRGRYTAAAYAAPKSAASAYRPRRSRTEHTCAAARQRK